MRKSDVPGSQKSRSFWRWADSFLKRASQIPTFFRLLKKLASLVIYYRGPLASERIVEYPFVLERLVSLLQPGFKVLDVGSGYATFTAQLAALGFKVCAIDLLDYPTKHDNLRFVRGDIMTSPFRPESFDAIVCISTLEHIGLYGFTVEFKAEDGDTTTMAELARITRRGGCILISVPFGRPYTSANYRVYDLRGLQERVIGRLIMEEMKTYWYRDGMWRECTPDQALQVNSFPGTFAVACLRLRV